MKYILAVLTAVLLALVAISTYLVIQNQKLAHNLNTNTSQAISSPSSQTSESTAPQSSPLSAAGSLTLTQDAIKTNTNSKNYGGLSAYMTDNIGVTLMSTDCCGPKTKDESIEQMSYVDAGAPFDFDQTLPTIKTLKTNNPRLTNAYIGISKSKEHLIAFNINPDFKITAVELSVSWKLYN